MILTESRGNIYRIKGILFVADENEKFIIQSVHNQYVVESFGSWETDERQTKLVFIGKNLNKELLEKGLVQCHASDFILSDTDYYKLLLELHEDFKYN